MGQHYSRLYKIDHGSTVPLGLYNSNSYKGYNLKLIRKYIIERKLSPFYKGLSDPVEKISLKLDNKVSDNENNSNSYTIECPICFLNYPSNINFTRCCRIPICTACFVQIKYSIKETVPCPFCMTENFGVHYQSPKQLEKEPCHVNNDDLIKRSPKKRRLFGISTTSNIVMITK